MLEPAHAAWWAGRWIEPWIGAWCSRLWSGLFGSAGRAGSSCTIRIAGGSTQAPISGMFSQKYGMISSMWHKGNCGENVMAESLILVEREFYEIEHFSDPHDFLQKAYSYLYDQTHTRKTKLPVRSSPKRTPHSLKTSP